MAIKIYLRVSTSKQHFAQQMQDIKNYFDTHGLRMKDVSETVEEKESGGVSYTDRKLQQLLDRCKPGDTIYAASTDRLGRNFVDMIRMMESARERGITIVACKQGLSLAEDSVATKIILSVTSIIDEDERMRIKHRVKNGVEVSIGDIRENGHRLTKRGTIQDHWGNAKGYDMSVATEAASIARQDRAAAWRESSKAVRFALRKKAEGWTLKRIVDEIGQLYEDNGAEAYGTPSGKKPSMGTVSRWLAKANPIMV